MPTCRSSEAVHKRPAPRLQATRNDVYVGRNTAFAALLQRCRKQLDAGEERLVLHGLGAAVNRCVTLALALHQLYGDAITVWTEHSEQRQQG